MADHSFATRTKFIQKVGKEKHPDCEDMVFIREFTFDETDCILDIQYMNPFFPNLSITTLNLRNKRYQKHETIIWKSTINEIGFKIVFSCSVWRKRGFELWQKNQFF